MLVSIASIGLAGRRREEAGVDESARRALGPNGHIFRYFGDKVRQNTCNGLSPGASSRLESQYYPYAAGLPERYAHCGVIKGSASVRRFRDDPPRRRAHPAFPALKPHDRVLTPALGIGRVRQSPAVIAVASRASRSTFQSGVSPGTKATKRHIALGRE
ncbi:hypothetical protein KCP69_21740 [Salmonella enterica subsp. enterica]|nr:hypothetical protein KCP69_21740 [Salmonella enterica subsp. enterica]